MPSPFQVASVPWEFGQCCRTHRQRLTVASLRGSQPFVEQTIVDSLRGKRLTAIRVIRVSGGHIIKDGHHRATAALLDGKPTIAAIVEEFECAVPVTPVTIRDEGIPF